jgi:hypothetical protein
MRSRRIWLRHWRRRTRRSSSVVAPHTPYSWLVVMANSRHAFCAGQARQNDLAASICSIAWPVTPIGKNRSGSRSRHTASSRQSRSFQFVRIVSKIGPLPAVAFFSLCHADLCSFALWSSNQIAWLTHADLRCSHPKVGCSDHQDGHCWCESCRCFVVSSSKFRYRNERFLAPETFVSRTCSLYRHRRQLF